MFLGNLKATCVYAAVGVCVCVYVRAFEAIELSTGGRRKMAGRVRSRLKEEQANGGVGVGKWTKSKGQQVGRADLARGGEGAFAARKGVGGSFSNKLSE